MSIEETKEAIRVMQAFVDGKEVEYQISDGTWLVALTPSWNWPSTRYRIKHTPVRCAKELVLELNAANETIRLQHELIATAEKRGVDKAKEELNAANERIKRLDLDCIKLSKVNQELQSDVNELKELVEYLQDRIKTLKKAGDDLAKTQTHDLLETINWTKAKEAKP